jgi:hypothetical protein
LYGRRRQRSEAPSEPGETLAEMDELPVVTL